MELEREGSGLTSASTAPNPDKPLNGPLPKPSGKKYFIVILGLLFFAGLIFGGFIYWSKKQEQTQQNQINSANKQKAEQKLAYELSALTASSTITFPKIIKVAPLDASGVPLDTELLVLGKATQVTFHTIEYGQNKGVQITYLAPSTTVERFLAELMLFFENTSKNNPWLPLESIGSNLVGVLNLQQNNPNNRARITLIQQNEDVKVIVQTISEIAQR